MFTPTFRECFKKHTTDDFDALCDVHGYRLRFDNNFFCEQCNSNKHVIFLRGLRVVENTEKTSTPTRRIVPVELGSEIVKS